MKIEFIIGVMALLAKLSALVLAGDVVMSAKLQHEQKSM